MKTIKIKRIYEDPSDDDGYRVLVDRLWPRGVSKEDAKLNNWVKEIAPSSEWMKDIAPSTELRKWFDHKQERFEEFERRYQEELKGKENELNELRNIADTQTLSLMYSAKNTEINQAVVLKGVLLKKG